MKYCSSRSSRSENPSLQYLPCRSTHLNVENKLSIFMDQTVQQSSNNLGKCCSPQNLTDLINPSTPSVQTRKSFWISCHSSSSGFTVLCHSQRGSRGRCYTWACGQTSWPIKFSRFNSWGNFVLFRIKCSLFSWRKLESIMCHLNKIYSL